MRNSERHATESPSPGLISLSQNVPANSASAVATMRPDSFSVYRIALHVPSPRFCSRILSSYSTPSRLNLSLLVIGDIPSRRHNLELPPSCSITEAASATRNKLVSPAFIWAIMSAVYRLSLRVAFIVCLGGVELPN